jgi:hypothetical protein
VTSGEEVHRQHDGHDEEVHVDGNAHEAPEGERAMSVAREIARLVRPEKENGPGFRGRLLGE